ncbi:hypothetical protein BCR39DRAFT_529758 [Naematelia encephala]|uniref:Tetraspanin Tsp2 n=1 Tax=Naematelia encephala TaxID=71784 RepID=A0A1Y2B6E1_9TREE|nr:hypothetical protein BCR39DRAFT_529758 [Naematelia encephala]
MSNNFAAQRRSRLLNLIPSRHQRRTSESTLQPLEPSPLYYPSSPGGRTGTGGLSSSPNNNYNYNNSNSYIRAQNRSPSPSPSDYNMSSTNHAMQETVSYPDDLAPPTVPFAPIRNNNDSSSGLSSSRRSSFSSLDNKGSSPRGGRPGSLSVNYVPAKFTKLHAPGDWAHRRGGKQGGGRDAFAKNASRMGQLGTVDDDEGVVFQLGKGGLKKKKPKLRWNRFKWALFAANSILLAYGMTALVAAILVWLNVFYQADVIRVGNRAELIISTIAAVLIVLTSLVGYAGVILNVRAFLAVYTLLLWACFALLVTPGYMTYKQRTFNLEGKINAQWSRNLGSEGRQRVQDALRCCGYFSPYVEATQSPLCYARSNFPGCKARYLRVERRVLEIWYICAFALVPVHIFIIVASLLCSNHITYRFGKGLTPKRYRLDLGSMAVIMDEYASQIAAQYGPGVAAEAKNRSSAYNLTNFYDNSPSPSIKSQSRQNSFVGVSTTTGINPTITHPTSRLAANSTTASGTPLYDPARDSFDATSIRDGVGYNNNNNNNNDLDSARWDESQSGEGTDNNYSQAGGGHGWSGGNNTHEYDNGGHNYGQSYYGGSGR